MFAKRHKVLSCLPRAAAFDASHSATLAYTTLITLALVRSTRAMAALSGSQPKVLVFGYGSNGVAQLRARCANPTLTLRPARLPDHARVFCLRSPRWGQGGVASLAPSVGQHCLGSVAELTAAEKELLDKFEKPAYRDVTVTIEVRGDDGA